MYVLFVSLALTASVVLVLVVLIQSPKGDGLGSAFGSQSAMRFVGVKQATDLLEKITWGTASFIMLLAVLSNSSFVRGRSADADQSPNLDLIQQTPIGEEDATNVQRNEGDLFSLDDSLQSVP